MSPRSSVSLAAPAKINLFLEITGRRPDGYHTLDTVFQEISLHDTVSVTCTEAPGVALRCSDPTLPVDGRNLVVRAALLSQERFGGGGGWLVRLRKRIPVGAGLGGGSSDAAATLKALAGLSGRGARAALAPLARRLGADVAFFLRGGLAAARGVGDRLSPLRRRGKSVWYVLLFPRIFSSTVESYRGLRLPLTNPQSSLTLRRALSQGAAPREWAPFLFNRLEEVVFRRLSPVGRAKKALLQAGCLGALMSGSGSSVFGVVQDQAHGRRVCRQVRRGPWDAWLVRGIDGR